MNDEPHAGRAVQGVWTVFSLSLFTGGLVALKPTCTPKTASAITGSPAMQPPAELGPLRYLITEASIWVWLMIFLFACLVVWMGLEVVYRLDHGHWQGQPPPDPVG